MEHSASRLCRALRDRDDAMVAALLQEGADPNLVLSEGVAAMHLAAGLEEEEGEEEEGTRRLLLLLQHGGDPNVRSGEGLTPLHVAASWGRSACLRLLLSEGGDPRLPDQDGNTAVDLAVEHGNEICVGILQGEGWSSEFSQRRAESFLSTVMEDAEQTSWDDSLPRPSGRLSPSSLKEARPRREPPGPNGDPGCTQNRRASSFLTECSWQGDTLLNLSGFGVWPVDSRNAAQPPRKPAPSRVDVQTRWEGEVDRYLSDAVVKQSWGIQGSAEGGGNSPPAPGMALHGPLSLVDIEALLFRPNTPCAAGFPQKVLPSAGLGTRSELEVCRVDRAQDASACNLSQVCGLAVRPPCQDGLDAACADPVGPFPPADSTAVSDLRKTQVVDPAPLSGCIRTRDGCWGRRKPPGRCSVAGDDRYVSCASECYVSAVEDPGCGCVHEREDEKAASCCSTDSCIASNGSLCSGPLAGTGTGLHSQGTLPAGRTAQTPGSQDWALPHARSTREAWQRRERSTVDAPENTAPRAGSALGAEGPTETRGLPREWRGRAPSGAREEPVETGTRGSLPTNPRRAEEGGPSPSSQDTVPVQWTSEGRNPFCGSGSSGAPGPPASVAEEPPGSLDAHLRSMMLATKVTHSPLFPSNRNGGPAFPWPQSPPAGAFPHESLSPSSLFEEPLEMPRRPRRVRRGPGPVPQRGAARPERSSPPERGGGEETEEGGAPPAIPRGRESDSNPGSRSLGGSLAGSGGGVGRGGDPSGRAESAAGEPSLENLGGSRRAEKTSRVSFSRLSARGVGPPGRLCCSRQEVPLSPGGRPTNLSATEPVEFLYVDEEEGHTLVERHIPPTDDSTTSSSEDTVVCDWQAYAGASRGSASPLNPEYLTDGALARRLRELGADPGPVTSLTRKLYVRLLERLSREAETPAQNSFAAYSPELAFALETHRIPDSQADALTLAAEFDRPDKSRWWREGLLKASFNYLLLDPRVTQNLPSRWQLLSPAEGFRTFVRAIFYVGKGTRARPYRHLYEALTHYREGRGTPAAQVCSKVQHILDIWAGGHGVVSLHCFQNVVPVEAYTLEACVVDAIGLKMLTNQKKGNYYGTVASWPMKRRRRLGVFLLHRALQIFLAEGERQLRPADI